MLQRAHSASLGEGAQVCFALATESFQNGPLSGAAADKDVASEAQNAPAAGWPGASQKFDFPMFLISEIHLGSASRKNSKPHVCPNVHGRPLALKRNTFSPTVVYNLANPVGSQTKINCWESFPSQKLFRTLDKPSMFVKARASK